MVSVAVPDVLLIPYGVADWPPDGLALEGFSTRSLRLRTTFPCAAVNRAAREPLRLNNSPDDLGPATAAAPGGAAEAVKDHLKGLCQPWDNLATAFLDGYFAFASALVEAHRDELTARLQPYAGLYDPRDWLFSAPKPLPRAHLHAPPPDGAAGADAFARVDFAFWLGDRLVAAVSAQGAPTPRQARARTERLRLAGIEVVPFGPADLADARAPGFFAGLLGNSTRFWEGEALPAGPFGPSLPDD